jgi:hypothetical protein
MGLLDSFLELLQGGQGDQQQPQTAGDSINPFKAQVPNAPSEQGGTPWYEDWMRKAEEARAARIADGQPMPDYSGGGDLGMSYSKAPDMSQYASGQGLLGMNPQFAQVQPQEQMNLQGNPARNKFLQSLLGG